MKIRLNENDLRAMVRMAVGKVLNESRRGSFTQYARVELGDMVENEPVLHVLDRLEGEGEIPEGWEGVFDHFKDTYDVAYKVSPNYVDNDYESSDVTLVDDDGLMGDIDALDNEELRDALYEVYGMIEDGNTTYVHWDD